MDPLGNTVIHESGHLLLSCLLKMQFECHRNVVEISTISNKNSICYTKKIDYKKKNNSYYVKHLLVAFAGFCAECYSCNSVAIHGLKSDIEEIKKVYKTMGIEKHNQRCISKEITAVCSCIIANNSSILNKFHNILYDKHAITLKDARRICRKNNGNIKNELEYRVLKIKKTFG